MFSRNGKQLVTCDREREILGYKAGRESLKKTLVSYNQEAAMLAAFSYSEVFFPMIYPCGIRRHVLKNKTNKKIKSTYALW